MKIRRAEEKDIPRMMELLGQVLQIHAEIRPDIFIPGTTKYTVDELAALLKNEEKPIYVAVDGEDARSARRRNSRFQIIWCSLSPSLSMIYASTGGCGDNRSENVCLSM